MKDLYWPEELLSRSSTSSRNISGIISSLPKVKIVAVRCGLFMSTYLNVSKTKSLAAFGALLLISEFFMSKLSSSVRKFSIFFVSAPASFMA